MLYGTLEQELPTPHGQDAIVIFNGVELPYSQKRDESPAGEKVVRENITDINSFRKLFSPTTLNTWGNNGVGGRAQKELFNDTVAEIRSIVSELEAAETPEDIDNIREHLDNVLENVVNFNKGGVRKGEYAVKAKIAREVFERHGEVIKARARVGQNVRQINESTGDNGTGTETGNGSVHVAGSDGSGGKARANYSEAYSVSAERDDAEKYYQEIYAKQLESDKKLHPEWFRQAQSRSNQSGFSYAQNRKGDYNGQRPTVSIIHNYDNSHKRRGRTPESVCPPYYNPIKIFRRSTALSRGQFLFNAALRSSAARFAAKFLSIVAVSRRSPSSIFNMTFPFSLLTVILGSISPPPQRVPLPYF